MSFPWGPRATIRKLTYGIIVLESHTSSTSMGSLEAVRAGALSLYGIHTLCIQDRLHRVAQQEHRDSLIRQYRADSASGSVQPNCQE